MLKEALWSKLHDLSPFPNSSKFINLIIRTWWSSGARSCNLSTCSTISCQMIQVLPLEGIWILLHFDEKLTRTNNLAYFLIFFHISFVFLHRFLDLLFHCGESFCVGWVHLFFRFLFFLNSAIH